MQALWARGAILAATALSLSCGTRGPLDLDPASTQSTRYHLYRVSPEGLPTILAVAGGAKDCLSTDGRSVFRSLSYEIDEGRFSYKLGREPVTIRLLDAGDDVGIVFTLSTSAAPERLWHYRALPEISTSRLEPHPAFADLSTTGYSVIATLDDAHIAMASETELLELTDGRRTTHPLARPLSFGPGAALQLAAKHVVYVLESSGGKLSTGTIGEGTLTLSTMSSPARHTTPLAIARDRSGGLVVLFPEGLMRYDTEGRWTALELPFPTVWTPDIIRQARIGATINGEICMMSPGNGLYRAIPDN